MTAIFFQVFVEAMYSFSVFWSIFIHSLTFVFYCTSFVPVMISSQEMNPGPWLFTVAEPQTSLQAVH